MVVRRRYNKPLYREILIAVTGLTPQIITETLYALHHSTPPVKINEIHILTTRQGQRLIDEFLINNEKGKLYDFLKEHGIPENSLRIKIHTLLNKSGRPIEDIRDTKDSESISNQIVSFIKDSTRQDNTRLHCSVAGGRKTMSVYLAYALSLFGRPQDKLYHVLISPPELENNRNFFYKPKRGPITIEINGRLKKFSPSKIKIDLAEIPYVRFLTLPELDPEILKRDLPYTEIVALTQKKIDNLTAQDLSLNTTKSLITIGPKTMKFPLQQLVLYKYFLIQKINSCSQPKQALCSDCTKCFILLGKDTKDTILSLNNHLRKETRGQKELVVSDIRAIISKVNTCLTNALSSTRAKKYWISSKGEYGRKQYGVSLDKTKIHIL